MKHCKAWIKSVGHNKANKSYIRDYNVKPCGKCPVCKAARSA